MPVPAFVHHTLSKRRLGGPALGFDGPRAAVSVPGGIGPGSARRIANTAEPSCVISSQAAASPPPEITALQQAADEALLALAVLAQQNASWIGQVTGYVN